VTKKKEPIYEAGENPKAPKGKVWICGACGKRSKHLYRNGIDYGWDESCAINATLCDEKQAAEIRKTYLNVSRSEMRRQKFKKKPTIK